MSITGNIDLLQAINATVTGVGSAPTFANYPIGELEESGLAFPIVLTYAGAIRGNARPTGSNQYSISRFYDIVCYARRRYQEDAITGKQVAYPILDALIKTYLTDATYGSNMAYILSCDATKVELDPASMQDQNESEEWTPVFAGFDYHGWLCSLVLTEEGSTT